MGAEMFSFVRIFVIDDISLVFTRDINQSHSSDVFPISNKSEITKNYASLRRPLR